MDEQDPKLRVISSLYDAVTDGGDRGVDAPYEHMFYAMDDVIAQFLTHKDRSGVDDVLTPHFQRASHVFDILSRTETETPLTFVSRHEAPMAALDLAGRVVATNPAFDHAYGPDLARGATLDTVFNSPADETRFRDLINANEPDRQSIINIDVPKLDAPLSMLAGHIRGCSPRVLFLTPVRPVWNDHIGQVMQQGFALTDAEVETLRCFVETGSIKGVAEQRGRSIRTVRTQMGRIFAQMGITGQTELALFLATLGGLQTSLSAPPPLRPVTGPQAIRSRMMTLDGHKTEVLSYGDPDGVPVLLLQSTHPVALTADLRRALSDQGVRVIAPFKPGAGKSAKIKGRPGPDAMAPVYADLLRQLDLGPAVIAGQASGGLYALELARHSPELARGVALIDTGVPWSGPADLMRLPLNMRRTMVPARYFPDLLYLPHRLVASNFRRSDKGEASVVEYFFKDCPEENTLTRTDAQSYDVVREILTHSFIDTDHLVDDVCRWAKDWRALLNEVMAMMPVSFLHGASNLMFRIEAIQELCARSPNGHVVDLGPGGQLAAFQNPTATAAALRQAAERQTQP